jgi:hypothetical protein
MPTIAQLEEESDTLEKGDIRQRPATIPRQVTGGWFVSRLR